jgi:hypothetical protein
LSGFVQSVRKNVGRMTEVVPDSEYQSSQHLLTHSSWDSRHVMDQVAMDADHLFGGTLDTGLIKSKSQLALDSVQYLRTEGA